MRVRTSVRELFCLIVYTRRQKSVIITETRILSGKTHIQTRKLPVLSRKPDGSFRDNIRVSVIVTEFSCLYMRKTVKIKWINDKE